MRHPGGDLAERRQLVRLDQLILEILTNGLEPPPLVDLAVRLIVGGPQMGAPEAADPLEDLDRFSVMVRHGYAWIGSTYRRGGYGVRMAAEDTDNSRQVFWSLYGRPERTLLHGQSWGGNVAAKASELYSGDAASG